MRMRLRIRNLFDPGSGIRDKHPGSATLVELLSPDPTVRYSLCSETVTIPLRTQVRHALDLCFVCGNVYLALLDSSPDNEETELRKIIIFFKETFYKC
jgi:hypothetical protein